MNSRQQTIPQMVTDQGQVSVTGLAKTTGVSEVTIRQDLNTFEKLSYPRYAHGPAVSFNNDDIETCMMSNYTLKCELAEFAASLVQPGETVFIESGSSNTLFAGTLGEQKKNATIITVSSYIAYLSKGASCEVILLGGVYQKKSESMVGPLTRQYIQQVHFNKAFTSINGWQPEIGFTDYDTMCIDVVNTVLEKECETMILTDSLKFDAVHSYSIDPVERFNRMTADSEICASDLTHPEQSKFTVHVVDA